MNVAQQTGALLALVEADRERQCAQILEPAQAQADSLGSHARAEALTQLRNAFAQQRSRRHDALAAAQAKLATQRRLNKQQRTASLLQQAWARLPDELLAAWIRPDSRAAWIAKVVATARAHLPPGDWGIVHATDWPVAEQQTTASSLTASGVGVPWLKADAAIRAGIKIVSGGNVIDGTMTGLLADRSEFESQLLRLLEAAE